MISVHLSGAWEHIQFFIMIILWLGILIGFPIFAYRMGKDEGRWQAEREADKEWEE